MARPKGSKNRPKDGNNVVTLKPKKAKKAAPVKVRGPVDPVMNDDEEAARIECFNAYRDTLKPLEARLATVKTQISKVYAQAKGDKFPKKLFAITAGLGGTRKQEQKIIGDIKLVRFAAKALKLPIANQLDFFMDAADDAGSTRPSPEAEGRDQYLGGKAAKPPYPPGTADHDLFMKGFYAEQEKAARAGIEPLESTAPKAKNGKKAAAAPVDDDDEGEAPWPDDGDDDPARPLAHH